MQVCGCDDTRSYSTFCYSFYVFFSLVQVIMHELEATNDTFDVASKGEIVLRFYCKFETFCLVKNRAPIYEHRATIWQTLQLGSDFNEAIVLRFTRSEYDFSVSEIFPIKAKLFSEAVFEILEKNTDFWSWTSETKVGDHQNSLPVIQFM